MDGRAWDDRYRGRELVWGSGPNGFLVEEVDGLEPGTALDVACGEGRNAIWLAEQRWRVTGIDFSSVALEKAARLATERGVAVEWLAAGLVGWEPPNRYDLVVVMYLHLPSELRSPIFTRLAHSVAHGGMMLVVGHDSLNLTGGYGGPQDPAVLYGPADVSQCLSEVLEIERAESVHRRVDTPDGVVTAIDALVRGRRV